LHKWLIAILVAAALVAGFSLGRMLDSSRRNELQQHAGAPAYPDADKLIEQRRPDFLLPDTDNRPRAVSEWDGRALLINFWATWCEPCRKEIPALNAIRAEFKNEGFEVLGVALDLPDQVAEFRAQVPVDYPVLLGQAAADEMLRRYGNSGGGLPYSVFVDRRGIIRSIHASGALDEPQLRKKVSELLKK
jgi:thiol-disulfide isomerase/thioredoxin